MWKGRAGSIGSEVGGHLIGSIAVGLVAQAIEVIAKALRNWLGGDFAGALTGLFVFLALVAIAGLVVVFQRYMTVLTAGAHNKNAPDRRAYDQLRDNLARGGAPAQIYARWLTFFLDAVDRILGDTRPDRLDGVSAFFGLRSPAPLWTAPAYDRCLLFALLFPTGFIFLTWVFSGQSGPAEQALYLPAHFEMWQRSLLASGLAFEVGMLWRYGTRGSWGSLALVVIAGLIGGVLFATGGSIVLGLALAGAAAILLVGNAAGVTAIGFTIAAIVAFVCGLDCFQWFVKLIAAFTPAGLDLKASVILVFFVFIIVAPLIFLSVFFARLVATREAITFAIAVGGGFVATIIVDHPFSLDLFLALVIGTFIFAAIFALVCAIAGYSASFISSRNAAAVARGHQGSFLLTFTIVATFGCFALAWFLPQLGEVFTGGSLLFLGLLTLLSAPFMWLSIGLTRALLRRGIELAGWWPYILALADAVSACIIVILLSFILVSGIHAYNLALEAAGAKEAFALTKFLGGMKQYEGQPIYWWTYTLFFVVLVPSLANLTIGGASLIRGIPTLSVTALRFLPVGKPVPEINRVWVAFVLTLQWLAGALFAVAAQALLVFGIVGRALPALGRNLLEIMQKMP